jgi:D-arabinose 1-dehydrogenase-like Zn-dependent alcohol dehydrogenase
MPAQVLVKLEYSGVCRSQLLEVRGKRETDHYLPHSQDMRVPVRLLR